MGDYSVYLNIIDATTSTNLVGASVYINGVNQGAQTTASLYLVTSDDSGEATIQVAQDDYNAYSGSIYFGGETGDASITPIDTIPMIASNATSSVVNLTFYPQQSGIQWILYDSNANMIGSGSSDNSGGATTPTLAIGSYNIVSSLTGYTTDSIVFTTDGTSQEETITLVAVSDPGTSSPENTPSITPDLPQPIDLYTASLAQPLSDTSEFVYPNDSFNKYFTCVNARMYIGNVFIDELNTVQFVLQQNAVPVYGYSSKFIDAYGQGRSLVQGQIVINYIMDGYLYTVLRNYEDKMMASAQTPAQVAASSLVANLQNQALLNSKPASAQSQQTQNQMAQELLSILSAVPPYVVADAKQQVNANNQNILDNASGNAKFKNPLNLNIYPDIEVTYGANNRVATRRLEAVKLISNEQICSSSTGDPIMEIYGFVCRRLR